MGFLRTWTLSLPLGAILLVVVVCAFTGYENVANTFSYIGIPVVLLANIAYIVFWDSRQRWPEASTFERFKRFMNFQR